MYNDVNIKLIELQINYFVEACRYFKFGLESTLQKKFSNITLNNVKSKTASMNHVAKA